MLVVHYTAQCTFIQCDLFHSIHRRRLLDAAETHPVVTLSTQSLPVSLSPKLKQLNDHLMHNSVYQSFNPESPTVIGHECFPTECFLKCALSESPAHHDCFFLSGFRISFKTRKRSPHLQKYSSSPHTCSDGFTRQGPLNHNENHLFSFTLSLLQFSWYISVKPYRPTTCCSSVSTCSEMFQRHTYFSPVIFWRLGFSLFTWKMCLLYEL